MGNSRATTPRKNCREVNAHLSSTNDANMRAPDKGRRIARASAPCTFSVVCHLQPMAGHPPCKRAPPQGRKNATKAKRSACDQSEFVSHPTVSILNLDSCSRSHRQAVETHQHLSLRRLARVCGAPHADWTVAPTDHRVVQPFYGRGSSVRFEEGHPPTYMVGCRSTRSRTAGGINLGFKKETRSRQLAT